MKRGWTDCTNAIWDFFMGTMGFILRVLTWRLLSRQSPCKMLMLFSGPLLKLMKRNRSSTHWKYWIPLSLMVGPWWPGPFGRSETQRISSSGSFIMRLCSIETSNLLVWKVQHTINDIVVCTNLLNTLQFARVKLLKVSSLMNHNVRT